MRYALIGLASSIVGLCATASHADDIILKVACHQIDKLGKPIKATEIVLLAFKEKRKAVHHEVGRENRLGHYKKYDTHYIFIFPEVKYKNNKYIGGLYEKHIFLSRYLGQAKVEFGNPPFFKGGNSSYSVECALIKRKF